MSGAFRRFLKKTGRQPLLERLRELSFELAFPSLLIRHKAAQEVKEGGTMIGVLDMAQLMNDHIVDRLCRPKGPEPAYLDFGKNKSCTLHVLELCRYIATLSAGNLKPRPSATRSALMGYFGLFGLMATIRKRSSFDRKVLP